MSFSYNQLTNIQQLSHQENEDRKRANFRSIFLSQDNEQIQHILKSDLQNYMDGYDISQLKLVTLDDFVKVFLESICLVHKNPAIIKVNSDVPDKQSKKFYDLLEEIQLSKVLPDTDIKMRLHNTILTGVRYFERLDKIYLDNSFNAGTTKVIGYHDYPTEPRLVIPVPPLTTGRVPVICEVRSTLPRVSPSVKLPELVTVPVRVIPLTVPVPLMLVTVPLAA